MKALLQDLFDCRKLTRTEARDILVEISEGKFSDALLASFLTVFKMRPVAVEELQGFRDALLDLCIPINFNGVDSIDIVGTGGDAKNTFNVSTLTSFVVAGAGYKVTKHGNYGVSSVSGSSNVLEHFGYEFTNDEDKLKTRLDKCGICFLHAPFFHPAMKAVGPVRRALGMKTFFNMLGPLVNPSRPGKHLFGVYSMNLARMYHYIMQETDDQFAIVYSLDGYDEISLTGPFSLKTRDSDKLVFPEDIGFKTVSGSGLDGGKSVKEAADIFLNILEGRGSQVQKNVVCANAGCAPNVFQPEKEISACISEASESLDSGNAFQVFKKAMKE
jgi:anthranilate phosphoribosyltransferase